MKLEVELCAVKAECLFCRISAQREQRRWAKTKRDRQVCTM